MPNIRQTFCTGCSGCNAQSPSGRLNNPLSEELNNSLTLLIFQAPGIEEWNQGVPIISSSPYSAAARIRNSLNRMGKSRGDFDITNSVQCYPGVNGQGRDKAPKETVRRKCQSWLDINITIKEYNKIIVFGSIAKKSVLSLGYGSDSRFLFLKHPSGGLKNSILDNALR